MTHSIIDKQVGSAIRVLRTENGLTQKELAEAIGVTQQQVQKYENGIDGVSAGRLGTIAQYLGADVNYFYQEALTTVDAVKLGRNHTQIMKNIASIQDGKGLKLIADTAKYLADKAKVNKKLN